MFYVTLTDPAVPTTLWRGHWSLDPDDDTFLATAFAFGAHLLISRDGDLLNLRQFYRCQIVDPGCTLILCRWVRTHNYVVSQIVHPAPQMTRPAATIENILTQLNRSQIAELLTG